MKPQTSQHRSLWSKPESSSGINSAWVKSHSGNDSHIPATGRSRRPASIEKKPRSKEGEDYAKRLGGSSYGIAPQAM